MLVKENSLEQLVEELASRGQRPKLLLYPSSSQCFRDPSGWSKVEIPSDELESL